MDSLKDRISELEKTYRDTFASLRSTVRAYSERADMGRMESHLPLLADAAQRIHSIIPLEGYAFFLAQSADATFTMSHHAPGTQEAELHAEFDHLVELGLIPTLLDKPSPLPRNRSIGQGDLVAHILTTPSRVRGLFIGLLRDNYTDLPETAPPLLSVILIQCAASLESFELYKLHREANSKLDDQLQLLKEEVAERKKAEFALMESERSYRSLVDNIPVGLCRLGPPPGMHILMANQALSRMLGKDGNRSLVGRSFRDFISTEEEAGRIAGLLSGSLPQSSFETRLASGPDMIWVRANGQHMPTPDNGEFLWEMVIEDITERRKAQERLASMNIELERKVRLRTRELEEANALVHTALTTQQAYFRKLFNNSPLGIVLTTPDGRIMESNETFHELFGHREESIQGKDLLHLIVPEHDRFATLSDLRQAALGSGASRDCIRKTQTGQDVPVYHLSYPVVVDDRTDGVIHAFQNISDRKRLEERLTHMAFHDPLTGLPNRSLLLERLSHAINRGRRRPGYRFALLLADLNRFKAINDSLGHPAGDSLLSSVAERMLECVRDVDTVSRLGGDEFAILLEEFESPHEAMGVAERIRESLEQPFPLSGQDVFIGASVGIVVKTGRYDRPEDILRDADIAMYRAKDDGGGYRVFDSSMHRQAVTTLKLESDLRACLANGGLEACYQPVMCLKTRTLVGFEALARWRHPELGRLNPEQFIAVAEESGLIHSLGEQIFRLACEDFARWRNLPGADRLMVSVNLSGHQLDQSTFLDSFQAILDETGIPPSLLKLELTESTIMTKLESRTARLNALKDMGMQIMIDDFGTGYTSLGHLRNLPVNYLKIDRSFISGDKSKDMEAIVKAVISMSKNLGLGVVAEGVERIEELRFLEAHRCDLAQGFYFSPPLDHDQAAGFILRHAPDNT